MSRRLTLEHLLAATPLLAIVASLAVVYAAEAVGQVTPTIFADELQWAQYSRGVAEDGVASIRGEPVGLISLYVYLIAPAWRLHSTEAAYEAVKYLNVLVMSAAAFPAYLLARRLVSKPAAIAVAATSVAVPAMVYSLYVLTEPLAYPWSVLSAWLGVEALARRTRGWIAAAVAVALGAPLIRPQLSVIPLALALAALLFWWRTPQAVRLRAAAWSRADTVALGLLAVGAFAILTRWLLHSDEQWRIATDTSGHIPAHARWAAGALLIGMGVLPFVAGLTGLFPRRHEALSEHDRAFLAVTVGFLAFFTAYTGLKGAFNEVTFSNRVDERNLFYVAPLLLVGAAVALERRRLRLVPLAGATALAAHLIVSTPLKLEYPYFDAPGFSIATLTNRELFWPTATIERALLVTLGVSVAIALVARFARGRLLRAGLGMVAVLVLAWNLTGQITASNGSHAAARAYRGNLPQPPNWIDLAAGDGTVTYLGQSLTTGDALRTNLLEFWNRSIRNVWTTDGTGPGPGPLIVAALERADGTLAGNGPPAEFVLADAGIHPVGSLVAQRGQLRLYRVDGEIRLQQSVVGVDEEGWMSERAGYNRFESSGPGELVVTLSREAFCPDPSVAPPAASATVSVGPLLVNQAEGKPILSFPWEERSVEVPNCEARDLRLPVREAPWRADVHVQNTFKPADFGLADTRILGVMVGFRFEPGS